MSEIDFVLVNAALEVLENQGGKAISKTEWLKACRKAYATSYGAGHDIGNVTVDKFDDAVTYLVDRCYVIEAEQPVEMEVGEGEDAVDVTAGIKIYTTAP